MGVYYRHKHYGIIIPLDDIIKNYNTYIQWESSPSSNWINNESEIPVKGQINRKTYLLNEIQSSKDWELIYDNEKLKVEDLYNLHNKVLRQYNETHDHKLLEYINEMIKNKLDIQHNLYKFNVNKGEWGKMSKTYKGWEILKMTEEGQFKEGDEIINNADISYFLNSDVGGTLFWSDEHGDIMMNNNLLFAEFKICNKFYGYNEVDYTQLEIGYFAYSNYTHQYYLISGLPQMCDNENITYALIRLEGSGYYYKSNSLDELKEKISMDGGETIIYKNIGIF